MGGLPIELIPIPTYLKQRCCKSATTDWAHMLGHQATWSPLWWWTCWTLDDFTPRDIKIDDSLEVNECQRSGGRIQKRCRCRYNMPFSYRLLTNHSRYWQTRTKTKEGSSVRPKMMRLASDFVNGISPTNQCLCWVNNCRRDRRWSTDDLMMLDLHIESQVIDAAAGTRLLRLCDEERKLMNLSIVIERNRSSSHQLVFRVECWLDDDDDDGQHTIPLSDDFSTMTMMTTSTTVLCCVRKF